MSTKTINYKMVLPEQEDYYDVDIFNENYTLIDEELKRLSDETDSLSEVAHSGSYKDLLDKPSLAAVVVATQTSPEYDGTEDIVFDGSSECMQSLNKMIENLTDGGMLYFKAGTYKLPSTLLLQSECIHLCGSGAGTVINCDSGRISVLNKSITVSNLCIESNNAPTSDTQGVILLDKMGVSQQADGFAMFNVTVKYTPSDEYGAIILETSSKGMTGIRLVGCIFESASESDKVRLINNVGDINLGTTGCASACIAKKSDMTAISGFALGGNLGITNEG